MSKNIENSKTLSEEMKEQIKEIEKKTGFNAKFAFTEEDITNDVFNMLKACAFKFGCDEDTWKGYCDSLKDNKHKINLVVLGNLFFNFDEEFRKLLSKESEFFTEKQKLEFYLYMELEMYGKAVED